MKTKLCKPILIPQDKTTWPNCLWLGSITGQLHLDHSYDDDPKSTDPIDDSMLPQQLILISLDPNEKINEGDLMYKSDLRGHNIVKDGKVIETVITNGLYNHKPTTNPWYSDAKKVIATQSQLSVEYIQQFVKEYNDFDETYITNPFTNEKEICFVSNVKDVEIEMEDCGTLDSTCGLVPHIDSMDETFYMRMKPKLTKEGFVTIIDKKQEIGILNNPKINIMDINVYYNDSGKVYLVPNHYNHSLEYVDSVLEYAKTIGLTIPDRKDITIQVLRGEKYYGMLCVEFKSITKPDVGNGWFLKENSGIYDWLVI